MSALNADGVLLLLCGKAMQTFQIYLHVLSYWTLMTLKASIVCCTVVAFNQQTMTGGVKQNKQRKCKCSHVILFLCQWLETVLQFYILSVCLHESEYCVCIRVEAWLRLLWSRNKCTVLTLSWLLATKMVTHRDTHIHIDREIPAFFGCEPGWIQPRSISMPPPPNLFCVCMFG